MSYTVSYTTKVRGKDPVSRVHRSNTYRDALAFARQVIAIARQAGDTAEGTIASAEKVEAMFSTHEPEDVT